LAEESNTIYPKGASGEYAQMIRQRIWKNEKVQASLKAANRSDQDTSDMEDTSDAEDVEDTSDAEDVEDTSDAEDVKHRPSE
jgi:hypothetical protein